MTRQDKRTTHADIRIEQQRNTRHDICNYSDDDDDDDNDDDNDQKNTRTRTHLRRRSSSSRMTRTAYASIGYPSTSDAAPEADAVADAAPALASVDETVDVVASGSKLRSTPPARFSIASKVGAAGLRNWSASSSSMRLSSFSARADDDDDDDEDLGVLAGLKCECSGGSD